MRSLLVFVTAGLVGSPLVAQSPSDSDHIESRWDKALDFSLSPRVGNSLPVSADDNPVDESEAEISVSATDKDAFGFTRLQAKLGVTTSPQLLDNSDAASAVYGQITLGDTFIPLRKLLLRDASDQVDAVSDAWRPYARYRFTRNYSDFFESYSRSDHQVTAGVRFRDIRTIMTASKLLAADEIGAESKTPGWYWEARGEVSQTWSTDDTRKRLAPVARVDVYSRPIVGGTRFFGRVQADMTFYQSARVQNGDKRTDKRFRLTAGFDVSDLLTKLDPSVSIELAAQYQRRWSNESTAEHERLYFTPSLSISSKF